MIKGYLRRYDSNAAAYTTVAFTKEQGLLETVQFAGYN
jgi:hypothetical protein